MNEKVKETSMIVISEFPLWFGRRITSHVELRDEFVVQLVNAYLGARS